MDPKSVEILHKRCEEAIDAAHDLPAEEVKHWCVNWGDIHVADIERRTSLLTPDYDVVVVTLEEAAPNSELARFVGNYIWHAYPDVEVVCEW